MNRREGIRLLIMVAALAASVLLFARIDTRRESREKDLVEQAVREAALTCYAAEGAYPSDLQYLRANYQLAYDESRFVIFYDAWGENVMPDITVSEAGVSGI